MATPAPTDKTCPTCGSKLKFYPKQPGIPRDTYICHKCGHLPSVESSQPLSAPASASDAKP